MYIILYGVGETNSDLSMVITLATVCLTSDLSVEGYTDAAFLVMCDHGYLAGATGPVTVRIELVIPGRLEFPSKLSSIEVF